MTRRDTRARSDETDRWRAEWKEGAAAWRAELERRHGPRYRKHDAYGTPVLDGNAPVHDVNGEDVALGLERAFEATGDPLFRDALAALRAYSLDAGEPRRSYARAWEASQGDPLRPLLEWMRATITRAERQGRSVSVRRLAEAVAPRGVARTTSYEGEVRAIERAYRDWTLKGFPPEGGFDHGGVGYFVHVTPRPDLAGLLIVPHLSERFHDDPSRPPPVVARLPAEGAVVPFTTYWRRRFHDGDVTLRRAEPGEAPGQNPV